MRFYFKKSYILAMIQEEESYDANLIKWMKKGYIDGNIEKSFYFGSSELFSELSSEVVSIVDINQKKIYIYKKYILNQRNILRTRPLQIE